MTVNSGTRWLPEPETFGSRSGRGCRPKVQTGHQPRSFGGRPNGARALLKSRVVGQLNLLRNLGDSLETPLWCLLSKWPPTLSHQLQRSVAGVAVLIFRGGPFVLTPTTQVEHQATALAPGVFFCPFKKLCQCFRYGYGPPDGYRLQIHVRDGRVKLYTINGYDWSKRYPRIVESRARVAPNCL